MLKIKPLGQIAVLYLAIACFTALGCFSYWTSLTQMHAQELASARAQNESRVRQLTEAATQQFDGTMRSVDTALQYLRDVYTKDRSGFDGAVQIVLANYPRDMLGTVVVFDAAGYLSYSSAGKAERMYMGDREHFQVHAQNPADQLHIGKPVMGRITPGALVPLSRPIRRGKQFLGVITIPVRPQYFADKFSALQVTPQDLLALVLADGSFIARNHKLGEALQTRLPPSRPFLAAGGAVEGIFRDVSTVDRVPMLFSWRRLERWPVSVVVGIDEHSALELLRARQARELRQAGGAIALVLAASLGVGWLLWRLARRSTQLADSERRFRTFFVKNGSVMLLLEPDSGRIVDANAAAVRFYGYPLDQLRGMSVNALNTLSPPQVAAEMQLAASEARNYFHFIHRLASGELRDVEVYSTPIVVNERAHLFSIVNDISRRREMEEERNLLALAVEQSPASIVVAQPDGAIEYVNDAFCRTTGYTRQEALGANPRILKSGRPPRPSTRPCGPVCSAARPGRACSRICARTAPATGRARRYRQ